MVPASTSARRTVHLLVEGRVQGVGFRAFVAMEADRSGLAGWVRNRRTGAVEAVIAGPRDRIGSMIEACRKGAPAARVDALFVIADVDNDQLGTFADFQVRPTA